MSERKRYSQELKTEAISMVLVQGRVQEEVARLLGIPSGTLANWVIRSRKKPASGKPGDIQTADLMAENIRLRKELAKATMEREILKKAAAYFAKESTQGTRS